MSEPAAAPPTPPAEPPRGLMVRVLGAIERGGNKMPHPAILFLWLCVGVIVISVLLAWADVKVTYEVAKPPPIAVEENLLGGSTQPSGGLPDASIQEGEYEIVTRTASIESLLSADGIRFLFTSFVSNFRNFAAVAIILVVMIGVGLAEASGLIGALIRKLVAVSSEATLTPFIVFIGILSSVASDAGYLVLIPLGAAAFKSVGRNPLAGMAAAFAGVAAGFGVNFLITPLDGVLTEITNDSIALVDPDRSIDLAANLFFGIGSTILLTIVITLVATRVVERSLGPYDPLASQSDDASLDADQGPEVSPEAEAKGLRYALLATAAVLTRDRPAHGLSRRAAARPGDRRHHRRLAVHGQPDRDHHADLLRRGLAYGRAAGTIRTSDEIIAAITKSWAGLASLIFLFLLIAQFIAYFSYSNIPHRRGGEARRLARVGGHRRAVWLLLGFIFVTALVNFIMPGVDRQVGDPRADLRPALPPARRRAADGAGRLSASATRRSTCSRR